MPDQLDIEAQDWQQVALRLAKDKAATDAANERLVRYVRDLESQLARLIAEPEGEQ